MIDAEVLDEQLEIIDTAPDNVITLPEAANETADIDTEAAMAAAPDVGQTAVAAAETAIARSPSTPAMGGVAIYNAFRGQHHSAARGVNGIRVA